MATSSMPLPSNPRHTPAVYEPVDKGLNSGAIGLLTSIVIGVASTAPAYSLAATLGFVVLAVGGGVQAPIIVLLAFVPILLVAYGYKELNAVDPDCGTTFTWATRTFGPITGWIGGWGIVGADVLVMASLAQVAGQYGFLLFNADGIGQNGSSGWVLLVGILWIVLMTAICYRGIELSARIQQALLSLEIVMLIVFSVTALIRVGTGNAPDGHLTPAWAWFNPLDLHSFSTFVTATLLMVFIYWGWDSAVACNEETKDKNRTPGRAAVISTFLLLAIYALVTVASQAFAGVGSKGLGLGNRDNAGDVLNTLGRAVFGNEAIGSILVKLLLLMVLTSASASTQTTILPTARTTLSMGAYGALPKTFAKTHPRYYSPTTSTLAMGGVSIAFYVIANYISHGNVIIDAVTACGMLIGLYYGLTGVACFWFFRTSLLDSARSLFMRGILPLLGGLMLLFAMVWSIAHDWNFNNTTAASYTSWSLPFPPHSQVGGVFILGIGTMLVGVLWMLFLGLRTVRNPDYVGSAATGMPPEVRLASVGRRIGAWFLAVPLSVATLGVGYVIWGLIVWPRGTSPALQVLGMRCWSIDEDRPAGFWRMVLRDVVGGFVTSVLSAITGLVSFVLFTSSSRHRSLADLVGGTVVVHDPQRVLSPRIRSSPFFRGETLNRATETLVPDLDGPVVVDLSTPGERAKNSKASGTSDHAQS